MFMVRLVIQRDLSIGDAYFFFQFHIRKLHWSHAFCFLYCSFASIVRWPLISVERISLSLSVFKRTEWIFIILPFCLWSVKILLRRKRSIHQSLKLGLLKLFKICMMFCDLMSFASTWGISYHISGIIIPLSVVHNYYNVISETTLKHGTLCQKQGMKAGCSQS